MAEGVGFEPTLRFPVNTLSKRAPSATRPPLRTALPGRRTRHPGARRRAWKAGHFPDDAALSDRYGGRHYSRGNRSDKALSQSQVGFVASPVGARRGIRARHFTPLAKPRRRPHCESYMDESLDDYLVRPDPRDPRLTQRVRGIDHTGATIETGVVVERALTIFLNGQEKI